MNVDILIVNGTTDDVRRLNLYTMVERLEEDQSDIVDIPAGESFELKGYTPAPEYLRRNFNAAITAAGGTPGTEGNEDVVYYEIVVPEDLAPVE